MPYLETEEEAAENIADINERRKKNKEDDTDKADDTDSEYDHYGFNKYGIHKDTNAWYDLNNFYINGKNRFTNNKYDINGFDIDCIYKDPKTKYDSNNFDINGIHKNTKISFSGNINKEKLLKNTLWLKNRYNFLKSYIKLLGEKNITGTVNNKVISLKIFEKFMNVIANGNINNYNIKKNMIKFLMILKKI